MSIAAERPAKLAIDRVVRRTIEVLQRNWRSLIRPALIYFYLPTLLVGIFRPHAEPFDMAVPPRPFLPFVSLLALIPSVIFAGGLIRLTIADLHAEPISTEDAIRVGRERMWSLFWLYLLTGLMIGIGFMLLIVPGVYAALAWCVVAPVLIEERRRIPDTYRRSADLTRGSRINILGVALIMIVLELVTAMVVGLISAPFRGLIRDVLFWPLDSAFLGVVTAVVIAVVYDELRELEGARGSPLVV
jgi:hypothetical protein